MQEHILIVDDNNDILELLEYTFRSAGYDVLSLEKTKHIRSVLAQEKIDLIVMDRSLPDIEGSHYVEMLRSKNITIPVIFLTGKDSQEDIKNGFLKGADDYITKPFDVEELLLRVKAVLRRSNSQTIEVKEDLNYKDISLDLNMQKVTIQDKDVSLTKLEATLLKLFIQNRGRVLDRNYLLKQAWKNSENIHQKTVNVAVKRLKEKIDPSNNKEYIKTIRGVGYMMA